MPKTLQQGGEIHVHVLWKLTLVFWGFASEPQKILQVSPTLKYRYYVS